MCDEDPKPGSSKELTDQDTSTKDVQHMTLAEYLALPENQNAIQSNLQEIHNNGRICNLQTYHDC